jgi:Mg2+ and Co2+ transporter CorA
MTTCMKTHVNLEQQTDKYRNRFPKSMLISFDDPRKRLRQAVNSILSDNFMIILTLLMLPIIIVPIFTTLSQEILDFFEICDILIIAIFIIEYVSKLYLAQDRRSHFKSSMHILDLIIILLPFIELFPALNISGSPTLLLRLLRLPRAFIVGSRGVVSRLRSNDIVEKISKPELVTNIRGLDSNLDLIKDQMDWSQLESCCNDKEQEWLDISDLSENDYSMLGRFLKISEQHIRSRLTEDGYPRIDYLEKLSIILFHLCDLKFPDKDYRYTTIEKNRIMIICNDTDIITVSNNRVNLFENIKNEIKQKNFQDSMKNNESFVLSVLYGILEYDIKRYKNIFSEIELEIHKMENLPRAQTPSDFLERIFQFKKEVSNLSSDLDHLKNLLHNIVSRRVPLRGFNQSWGEFFDILLDEASYLYESTNTAKENVLSIIDLHISRTSYETNQVMKVLAVITCLGVIPSIIGGLLGENLIDLPFPFYLWQIVAFVLMGMFFVAYIFYKLGWMKS